MANARSVAIRQAAALDDLQEACVELGRVAGVDAPDLAHVTHRDPGIETALRLETLAAFVRAAVTAGPVTAMAETEPSPPAPSPADGRGGSERKRK